VLNQKRKVTKILVLIFNLFFDNKTLKN